MQTWQETSFPSNGKPAVLIVGGGLVGLSTSLFLSWYGIPNLLVERHPGISPHPRASGFNARTLELFRMVGIEPLIRAIDPPSTGRHPDILHVDSLAGRIHSSDMRHADEDLRTITPLSGSVIPQSQLEPILRQRAELLGADIRFNTELLSYSQQVDGIRALIRDRETGCEEAISTRYLVAADGSQSPIRQQLHIDMSGPGTLAHYVSILFQTDDDDRALHDLLQKRSMAFCFIENERAQGTLGFSPDGKFGMLFSIYHPEQGQASSEITEAAYIELVRAAIGLPDTHVHILSTQPWKLAAGVADSYRQGNIFLAGDAVHVMPPTGGMGANTGIQDAYNLAWKLAYVLKGYASPTLLDSYEDERRPIAQLTVEQSCIRYAEHMALTRPIEYSSAPLISLTTVAFGHRYASNALCNEAEEANAANNTAAKANYEDPFHPSAHPGSRAPYVSICRGGKPSSLLDLFGGDFVLLTTPEGARWREITTRLAEKLGSNLEVYTIQQESCQAEQPWYHIYGISTTGAVLVRPDGFIGWRAPALPEQPEQALEQALGKLLAVQQSGTPEQPALKKALSL